MIEPLLQRFVRRHRVTAAEGVVFHSSSRVFNIRKDPAAISIGRMTHIRGELLTFANDGRIAIGEYCYVGESSRIWSARSIRIGDRAHLHIRNQRQIADVLPSHHAAADDAVTDHSKRLGVRGLAAC